ncbi:hypothetical protein [Janibacter alittae]|uniref:Uncharacterized protein n=1 Tax=Janibacter alittae TaxID=3115209 RepID=A0ABZ2MLM7_9MICO
MMGEGDSPVGLYWDPETWGRARAAYVSDLDRDPECPDAYIGWLHLAIEGHVERGHRARAEAGIEQPARRRSGQGLTRTYPLKDSLVERMEDAIAADRREDGRFLGPSAFVHEAVTLAIDEAIARRGGVELPPPPAKLTTRPRRRGAQGEVRP